MSSIRDKAQEVLKEDFDKAKVVVSDTATSRSYIYPIKGMFYFVSHPNIWKPIVKQILPMVGVSIGVVTAMFTFTYIPQFSVLVFVNGPLAVFTTVLLVLSESSTIINMVARNWILKDAILDTFDGVLLAKNAEELVAEGREVKSGADPMKKLGKLLKSPFEKFSPKALIRYILYLPLNFIPVVGTVIFVALQGRNRGGMIHGRYFQLKRWSASQRQDYLNEHKGPYTAFGLVATLLEMVPFVSIFFSFTNTTGAALWAVDLEQKSTLKGPNSVPDLEETGKKVD
ncbi:hypothetical protein MKZ38_009448 [Zalerion maritima]|uniref:Outer spore wall protein RRT8 n=1 Tax=Zalerion maritima TaxID=339359 RepID=A0AAD5WV24_9PEZI|nr:hypothetical protein MKZ38_009448 [Zalerion maritima]